MEGYSPKIVVGRSVTQRLRVYAWRLRANLVFGPRAITRTLRTMGSGVSGPMPGESGLDRTTSQVLLFWVYFVAHEYISRFSWALVLNQSLWIKSLLIVRRSYTQFSKLKSSFLSTLEHRLFISFFEGSHVITWFTYTNLLPAHMLNHMIKYTCVLSLLTKTHLGA